MHFFLPSCLKKSEKPQIYQDHIDPAEKIHPFFRISDCDSLLEFSDLDSLAQMNYYDSLNLPQTILEALYVLDTGSNSYTKHVFKSCDEITFHFGLGMWMRNSWGLWSMSNLTKDYFKLFGMSHIDDISNDILKINRIILNSDSLELNNLIEHSLKYSEDSSALLQFKREVIKRFPLNKTTTTTPEP